MVPFLSKPLFTVKLSGILLSLAILFLVGLFLYSFRSPVLIGVSELLIENQTLKETEFLLILGGDITSAVDYAASIYSTVQPRLILVSPVRRANQVVGRLTKKHRLSSDRIRILPSPRVVTSTYEEALAAIIHKFGVSVDFLRKFRAESVFRCDYKASKLVEPNRDEARAPSGNSSARRGLYICVGAGSQGNVRWDTDGASVMRRAFVRDKTMPGAPRCDEKFPEPGHRF